MKKLLEIIKNLFSLGGNKDQTITIEISDSKYSDHILLHEPKHFILEYHYLILNEEDEPFGIRVERIYKPYVDEHSMRKMRNTIGEDVFTIKEYENKYHITYEEIKKMFTWSRAFMDYSNDCKEEGDKIFFYHRFENANVELCYEYSKSALGSVQLDVVNITKSEIKKIAS